MTQVEMAEAKLYLSELDASTDEIKMLISFLVTECCREYLYCYKLAKQSFEE